MRLYIFGFIMLFVQIAYGQTTGTYEYDGNGNVIADSYNNIAFIQYDINNLPIAVYKTDGTKIEYSYNANGERVRKSVGSANTYYIQGADGQTEAIANDDPTKTVFNIDKIGRAERQGSTWIRSYYLKDHLGTIRMTLADNGSIISYDDYYPFGLYMPGRSGRIGDAAGRYKFTGKERDVETGLDYFGARYYDSRIGRWMAVDPLALDYQGWSPYNYCANNPIKIIDPDGMRWAKLEDEEKANEILNKLSKRQFKLAEKIHDLSEEIAQTDDKSDLSELQTELDDVVSQIKDVRNAMFEICGLGVDQDKVFTFNAFDRGDMGGLTYENNIFTINYGKGDFSNQVHELKHAAQARAGLLKLDKNNKFRSSIGYSHLKSEIEAHRRQFSVTGRLPRSDEGTPKNFNAINNSYLWGIYYYDSNGQLQRPYRNSDYGWDWE